MKWWQKSFGVLGGLGVVLGGIAKVGASVAHGIDVGGIIEGVTIISGGLSAIGVRRKQQKNGELLKATATGGGGTGQ